MILILGLVGYAAVTVLGAPRLLTRATWSARLPRLALVTWHASLASAAVALLGSIGYAAGLILVSRTGHDGLSGAEITMITVFCWLSLGGLGAALMAALSSAEPVLMASRLDRDSINRLLVTTPSRSERRGRHTVRILDTEEVFAAAVRLPEPTVLLTTGLTGVLNAAQLEAVISHERCHLTQRHDLAVTLASLYGASTRFYPARHLHQATGLLVELIADDAAARRCGAGHLATALHRIAKLTGGPASLLRARRIAERAPTPATAPGWGWRRAGRLL